MHLWVVRRCGLLRHPPRRPSLLVPLVAWAVGPSSPVPPAAAAGPLSLLDQRVQFLASHALAAASKRAVSVAERNFQKFSHATGISITPGHGLSDEDLARYVAWITADGTVKSSNTVSTYLSMGVRRIMHQRLDVCTSPTRCALGAVEGPPARC
jgi:hypothetical protein